MTDADEIRNARQRAGLTQGELGALVGVSLRTIGNWERGTTVPLNRLAKLREVLDGHWSGDENDGRSVALGSASDAELLAEIARRFSRTSETKAGTTDGTPMRPVGNFGTRHAPGDRDSDYDDLARRREERQAAADAVPHDGMAAADFTAPPKKDD